MDDADREEDIHIPPFVEEDVDNYVEQVGSVALHKLIRIFAKINRSMVILGQLTRSSRSQYNCPHSLISYDFLALKLFTITIFWKIQLRQGQL